MLLIYLKLFYRYCCFLQMKLIYKFSFNAIFTTQICIQQNSKMVHGKVLKTSVGIQLLILSNITKKHCFNCYTRYIFLSVPKFMRK